MTIDFCTLGVIVLWAFLVVTALSIFALPLSMWLDSMDDDNFKDTF